MQEATASPIPPSISRVLRLFRSMGREEKMQALVQYSRKLEPFPERLSDIDRTKFNIP
jgi:sulfur transfer protein SufE